jgi:hypothetical protein
MCEVINLQGYRAARNMPRDERLKKNEAFAAMVLSRWHDYGPSGGPRLYTAILDKARSGPIATRERAAILLPVLLDVLDDMDEAQFQSDYDAAMRDQPA